MRKNISASRGAALLLGGAVLTVSGQAAAAACPTGSNTVYVSGSSAFKSVLAAAQSVLGSTVNIVYTSPGSCEGLGYILGSGGGAAVADPSAPSTVAYSGGVVSSSTCTGTPAGGVTVDVGISDVYQSTCLAYNGTLNSIGSSTNTKEFFGPIQAMTIAVPAASTANSISAEAAYMVFRYAAGSVTNTIAPWTIPGDIFVRYYDSGTLEMIGLAIGDSAVNLPGGLWKNSECATPGTSACPQTGKSTGDMQTKITTAAALSAADQNATIGILAAQSIETGIKALAFQASGQSCGYLPDSGLVTGDKLNVRQGRYAIWGPEHLVTNVDTNGNIVGNNGNTAAVQALIAALTATATAPVAASVDGGTGLTDTETGTIIDAISAPASGVIPQCAMQVQRSSEIGPESSYQPPATCSCRFALAATGTLPSSCVACPANACTGSTPVCRFGYCEVQ
jgi:hypothetical protein